MARGTHRSSPFPPRPAVILDADIHHQLEKSFGTRPLLHGTAEEIIDQYNSLGAMLAAQIPPPDPSVKTRDEKIDSNVTVRI